MNAIEYKQKMDELFARWQNARHEYEVESEDKRFTLDGIVNYEQWVKSDLKILFLLKENHAADDEWEPIEGITVHSNKFSLNIARWRQILIELFNNPDKELSFENIELPNVIEDIAIIEVKKLNERKGASYDYDIKNYAINDKDFIVEQFSIINPNIILCCKTGEFYGENIYGDDTWEMLISDSGCVCYKHGGRLVIDFYHPSIRLNSREKELFEILCRTIKKGHVFRNFNWYKKR